MGRTEALMLLRLKGMCAGKEKQKQQGGEGSAGHLRQKRGKSRGWIEVLQLVCPPLHKESLDKARRE